MSPTHNSIHKQPVRFWRRVLGWLNGPLGWLVSLAALYLAVRQTSWSELWTAIRQAQPGYVALALGAVLAGFGAKAIRWLVLLGPRRQQASLVQVTMAHIVGQLLNLVYPARLGDLARANVIGGLGPGRVFTLGTLVLEKVLDLLGYGALFVLLLIPGWEQAPLPDWLHNSGLSLGLAALLVLALAALMVWRRAWVEHRLLPLLTRRFSARLQSYTTQPVRSGLDSLEVLRSPSAGLQLAFWTALVWLTAVLTNYWTLLAFGLQLPWPAAVLVLVILQVGISAPGAPGRIGYFEWACIFALAFYQVEAGLALSYGLVLHAVAQAPLIMLGVIFLRVQGFGLAPAQAEDDTALVPLPGGEDEAAHV